MTPRKNAWVVTQGFEKGGLDSAAIIAVTFWLVFGFQPVTTAT